MLQWIKLNPYSVKTELDGALYRNNVEEALFHVELLETIRGEDKEFFVTATRRTSVTDARNTFKKVSI